MNFAVSELTTSTGNLGIGGVTHEYLWTYAEQPIRIAYETLGQGSPLLLLPAFSTVSTRSEMAGLATQLASQFQVIALDWPGFGQSERPALNYSPGLYHQFLQDFLSTVIQQPIGVIAAGHAAGYAVYWAQQNSQSLSRLVLVAPTWRGPLRVMGVPEAVREGVKQTIWSPLLGQTLYRLNTTPGFLRFMYRQHVFTHPERLTPEFMAQKHQVTQQPGGRFAPAAFVTGALDPVRDSVRGDRHEREQMLAWVRSLTVPLLVVTAEQAPPQSQADMIALSNLPSVEACSLPGSLGLHEEYATEVAAAILPFLKASQVAQG